MKLINHSDESIIKDLFIVSIESFKDHRGENFEGFNDKKYEDIFSKSVIWKEQNPKFIIDSFSKSTYSVLRGFHGDLKTWKLIQCLKGEIQFVVIDVRKNSETYNKIQILNLNDKNKKQVLVPPECVNAHLCLSEDCLFHYKLTHDYVNQNEQIHIKWNDLTYNINWKIKNPILSLRDS